MVHGHDRDLALAHGALRQSGGGDGRGPRQGTGERPASNPDDDHRAPASRERRGRGRAGAGPAAWRRRRRHRGRPDPRRRRDHRGRRLGRRVRHHRRVRPCDPRGRRRPLRRHGRHTAAVRPARHRGHAGARQVLPRSHDRPRRGRRAAQDPERDRPQHSPGRADHHLPRRHGDPLPVRAVLRHGALHDGPDRAPRRAHSDHDRRPAVGDRHRRDGPHGAAQCARHVGTGSRGGRGRRRAAARQDRHDHARQPAGSPSSLPPTVSIRASWPRSPSSPRWPTRRRRGGRSSSWRRSSTAFGSARCRRSRRRSSRSQPRPG